ncbi:hypothetical protein [Burkholderia anthina]|uniref:hypothetical protein n=1 Tax=Burkholderia anthina TaxID=179879 RepID=UPI00158AEE82|nr:hypothetical protein [Burkholderia anthina]
MQINEDLDDYLLDFGDEVTAPERDVSGWGIFSQPDREVFSGAGLAPNYMMLARTDQFGDFDYPDRIVVLGGLCAGAYTVTSPAERIGDGAFCNVFLSKVRR